MISAAIRSPVRAMLLIAIGFRLATGWLLATRPTDLNVGDPGQWIDAGDRILRGEWPYNDWTGIYGPLLYAWGAFWYGLLGADWRAALLMLEVISPITSLLVAAATAKLMLPTPNGRAAFIAAVAVIGLDAFYWSPGLRIWAPVAALAWAAHPPAGRWSWLPFFACGLTPLLSPDTGIPCVISSLLLMTCSPNQTRLLRLMSLVAPSVIAIVGWTRVTINWHAATSDLASVASWVWGSPFPGEAFRWRRVSFLLPMVALFLAAIRLGWTARRTSSAARWALMPDIAIWILAVGCVRSLLGRTDTAHLLFICPPLLLLAFRFAVAGPLTGRIVLIAGCLPFMWLSGVEGPVRRTVDAWTRAGGLRSTLGGEHVALPDAFSKHLDRVRTAAIPFAGSGQPVLSLPVPIFAHLLRRIHALPLAVPELLAGGPHRIAAAITSLTAAGPPVVIVDPGLALPWDEYFLKPVGGPLTWSTPADEAITRELRDHLRRWYDVRSVVDGAKILTRRKFPRPDRSERIVMTVSPTTGDAEILAGGGVITLNVHGAVCDELRTLVRLGHMPCLGSLAKSYTRVIAVELSGKVHEMVQPLPPEHLHRELRWPVPRRALDRIVIEAGNPGSFNPDPRSATIAPIRLIRYGD